MNILSLDGGGIRGVLPTIILSRIRKDIISKVDVIIGTSIGGITALALASGKSFNDITDIYKNKCDIIFSSRGLFDKLSPDELVRADYDQKRLKEILYLEFGDSTLADLSKRVIIPALDLISTKDNIGYHTRPKFYDSGDKEDKKLKVVDVALMTSAAPTYFPSYNGHIDGALFANNPSDAAIAFALNNGINLIDVKLLSIGTGLQKYPILDILSDKKDLVDLDWGILQWAPHIIQLIMNSSVITSDFKSQKILGNNYFRFNPLLDRDIALDDTKEIDYLIKIADNTDINELIKWININW